MKDSIVNRAKKNIFSTFIGQMLSTAVGIIIPNVMISAYGSEAYGATTSIAQFLSYIALLEGGLGSVGRGELYAPLAKQDHMQVSRVYYAIKRFFRMIGFVFMLYTAVLAVFYYDLAKVTVFSRQYTFWLVISVSLFTMGNYMGGISNMTLMHADQKQYLTYSIISITNVVNVLSVVVLVHLGVDIMTVKLASSLIFIVRPILYWYYVKKHYVLYKVPRERTVLSQKWAGIGQHVAYFLHSNTDVVLLTLLANLKTVAVYAVYNLVVKSLWNITSAFSSGMEGALGEIIFQENGPGRQQLHKVYRGYKLILTLASVVLFGTAMVMLIPFVKLYTAGVTDVNYIQPVFGVIMLVAEFMNCVALPCHTLPISANQLKKSQWGSYGEALINITVSLSLIRWDPLLGVAVGTLVATAFKSIYYMIYSAKHILKCDVLGILGRFFGSTALVLAAGWGGVCLIKHVVITNYLAWAMWGVIVALAMSVIGLTYCVIAYPGELKLLLNKTWNKIRGHNA